MSHSQQQPQQPSLVGGRRPANATGSSSTSTSSSSWPNRQPLAVKPSSRALASNAVAQVSSAATSGRLGVGHKVTAASKLWGSSSSIGSLSSLSSSTSTNSPKTEPKKRAAAGSYAISAGRSAAAQNTSRRDLQQLASMRAAATAMAAASACRRVLGGGSINSFATAAASPAAAYPTSNHKAAAASAAVSEAQSSVGFKSNSKLSEPVSPVPFVSRAAYEQRRLANQLAKARMHQLLGERKQQQQQQEQQQQQGAEQEVEVVITTRRGIQDAVAAQAGERVAKAAVEFVYRYQRWGSLEESAAAAQWRVGVALAAQARTLRQESPGCCSSAVLRHYRTAHRTAKREHELLHLALAQVQQAQAQQS